MKQLPQFVALALFAVASPALGQVTAAQCRNINIAEALLMDGFRPSLGVTHIKYEAADEYMADGTCKYVSDLSVRANAEGSSCDDARLMNKEITMAVLNADANYVTTRMLGWVNSDRFAGGWDMQVDITVMQCDL